MIHLLTAASAEYKKLVDLTSPGKFAYAHRHAYKIACLTHSPGFTCWERPRMWRDFLESIPIGDSIFWTGADAGITDLSISIESLMDPQHDFYFAVDHHGLQCDSWIMRKTPDMWRYLLAVCAMEGKEANEQDAMQVVLSCAQSYSDLRRQFDWCGNQTREDFFTQAFNRWGVRCKILPRELINALPHEHYSGTGKEPYSWSPQSLVVHFPGKSLEWRLENMPRYLAKV